MTEAEFMKKYDISPKTLKKWKDSNWLKGAAYRSDGSYYIPEGALPPYARRRVKDKNGVGMYLSLLRGIAQGCDVFPELYEMHPQRFQQFIDDLMEADFIRPFEIDGVVYYHPRPKCRQCCCASPYEAQKILSTLVEAAARGTAAAYLDKYIP